MLINITLVGDRELVANLARMPDLVVRALGNKVEALSIELQSYIITKKLHGQVLHQRSGQLAGSIQRRVEILAQAVYGIVFSAGNVKYAAIHEFGGTIHHPGGTPYFPGAGVNGGALFYSNKAADALAGTGHPVLRTAAHDIPMPERSFMRSSLGENRPHIESELKEAALAACRHTLGGIH